MTIKPTVSKFIYSFNYNDYYEGLCSLEVRQVFNQKLKRKHLLSELRIDPSISPFIKSRFEIIRSSNDYSELLEKVKRLEIHSENFKAEYLVLEGDTTDYKERLKKLKDIGYRIEGEPDYIKPKVIYSICFVANTWYFGLLKKHDASWQKHKEKPRLFSNALNMNIAKALVGIASKGDKSRKLLDACCGVGTILLEACMDGFDIEGCDINWKAARNARENLSHYNYTARVHRSDIKDIDKTYDTIIIDLPYNHTTSSDDLVTQNIIQSSAQLTSRLVIVSIEDIKHFIEDVGYEVTDFCTIEKRGKSRFTRSVWVCEKVGN